MPTTVEIEGVGAVDFPDSMSAEQIHAKVRQLSGGPAPAPADALQSRRPKGPTEPLARWVLDALPTLGGIGLGTLGGIGGTVMGFGVGGWPGAMAGASAGGAGGEALRQLGYRALGYGGPESPEDALRRIATEGAIQGASEGGGRLLAAGVGATARPLMKAAVKPTGKLLRQYGDVVGTMLEKRIPAGAFLGKAGSEKASEMAGKSAGRASRILAKADRSGIQFTAHDARPAIDALLADVAKEPAGSARREVIERLAEEFYRDKGTPMNATAFNETKRAGQRIAKSLYGSSPDAAQAGAIKEFNAAVAGGARDVLESRIPKVAPVNANTKRLIGAQRAAKAAEDRTHGFALPVAAAGTASMFGHGPPIPDAAAAFLAAHALTSPEGLSRLALINSDPRILFLLGQLPRGGATLFPREYSVAPDSTR